jgi:CHAT domain-containing protein
MFRSFQIQILNSYEYCYDNHQCKEIRFVLDKAYKALNKLDQIDGCRTEADTKSARCFSIGIFGFDLFSKYSNCLLHELGDYAKAAELIRYFEYSYWLSSLDNWSTAGRAYNIHSTQGIGNGNKNSVQALYPNIVHYFNSNSYDESVRKIGLSCAYRFKNSDFFAQSIFRNKLRQNKDFYKIIAQLDQQYVEQMFDEDINHVLSNANSSRDSIVKILLPDWDINDKSKKISIENIVLESNEALIEIVESPEYEGGYQVADALPNDYFYIAYLLTPKSLDAVPLCKKSDLKKLLLASEIPQNTAAGVDTLLRGGSLPVGVTLPNLSNLVWPFALDSILKVRQIKTIWLSSDGLMHRVPFSAVKGENGLPLGSKYRINTVVTTRLLAKTDLIKQQIYDSRTAFFFGGVDYQTLQHPVYIYSSLVEKVASLGVPRNGTIRPLPGTLREVTQIQKDAGGTNWKIKVFTDKNASETQLKKLSGTSPRVIHLATHGFYHALSKDSIENGADLPFFRSGLLLAGAQKDWDYNNGIGYPGRDDGILTAFEVGQLDFTDTELVVLSACETGRGDILEGEGVFGLQRAFKLAGARFVMMSLWQIDDSKTADFMVEFYKRYFKSNDVREAFHETQRYFIDNKVPPYYWAAFILIE